MPVRNGGPYLAPAVESILGQTFADFEFVIVNDGSTDSTAETLRWYQTIDPRLRRRARRRFRSEDLRREVRTTKAYRELTRTEWPWVLDFITRGSDALQAYPEYSKVVEQDGRYVTPAGWWRSATASPSGPS